MIFEETLPAPDHIPLKSDCCRIMKDERRR